MDKSKFITPLAKLITLLPRDECNILSITGDPDVSVNGIAQDSRKVEPGNVFVARAGSTIDGHQFVLDAIKRGASSIVGEKPLIGLPVPYIHIDDGRIALAHLAAAFYGFPSRKLVTIGVTGTDGKTTTCNLIYQILKAAGKKVGMITTVSAMIGERTFDTGFHVTTPDAQDLQRYLAEMVDIGLTHVVLEITSHGLDQHRATGCEFDIGVITNITHEHLDYHGSYEAYRDAKLRLFASLLKPSMKEMEIQPCAVYNREDESFEFISSESWSVPRDSVEKVRQITFGLSSDAEVYADNVRYGSRGSSFNVVLHKKRLPIECKLIGNYNILNCLAAISATIVALGLDWDSARMGIAQVSTIPGRMEILDQGQEFLAIVDFAHTPNALKKSLEAARQLLSLRHEGGRIIAVFGSAGLRDRAKRTMMAEISIKLADLTIFTAEDPRTESLTLILAEMAKGAIARGGVEGKNFWRIPDRGDAIRFGLALAQPGDIVIALGKGHEQSMCFGEIEYPWDDRVAMESGLAELLRIDGPSMPILPTTEP